MSLLTPQHSRTTGVLPTGILSSLDSSGSSGPGAGQHLPKAAGGTRWRPYLTRQVFWMSLELSHELESPHSHNSHSYETIVRERGRQVTQKNVVGEAPSKCQLNILLCAGSAATGSPEWQYAGCCQRGNGG